MENKVQIKLAWGITGGGHMLEESVNTISALLDYFEVDVFLSKSAEEVLKQYKLDTTLTKLKDDKPAKIKIIKESQQNAAFPASVSLGLNKYRALIISPMTGNTVAKSIHCIADTLVTNCFAQALKSHLPIYCTPTDFREGELMTKIPSGKSIPFTVDKYSAANTEKLGKMKGVQLIETPTFDNYAKIFEL